jgi:cysteine desulfurase family protein (TIGR01976 family)
MTFDIARVRERYPALAEGYAHFDAAAGSLVAVGSSDAITAVTRGAVANRTMAFAPGRRAYGIVEEARAAVADLVGGSSAGVVFGQSATALTYLVARTLGDTWREGDEVVLSRLDHDANVRPWVQAAARVGARVRWAEVDTATGVLDPGQYGDLVGERTRLVAVTAASNAIGARPDVAAIAAIAHAAGALTYVDGVHATPHAPTDVHALGADFYVTSAYKWSGPHIAACVASPDQWATMAPDKLIPAPDEVPDRFEHGTLSFELLAGVTGAVDHLASLAVPPAVGGTRRSRLVDSLSAVQTYEMDLFAVLVDGLKAIDGVHLCPAPADRCPTIAFRISGQHPAKTADLLGEEGVCVFSGDYYAYEYFTAVGLRDGGGAVRAGIYHYTTREDVARLLDAVMRCR